MSPTYLYTIIMIMQSESILAVKSVVEMMIKIEERGAQDHHDQLVLGQGLSIKVFNDACSWVRKYGNLQVGNRYA